MRSGVFHLKSTVWRGVLQITSARIHVTRSVNHALTVTTRFLNGFSFVARQKRIVVDGDDFRIDLVFLQSGFANEGCGLVEANHCKRRFEYALLHQNQLSIPRYMVYNQYNSIYPIGQSSQQNFVIWL